jgi:mannosyltransferase
MLAIEKDSSRTVILLAAITISGAILRLYDLTFQSLWFDELHTVIRSSPANSLASILGYAKDSEVDQPPAFFLFTQLTFELFGVSEWIVRFGSAMLGIVAIPVMYFVGREVKDSITGFFAATLTAFNYFHIVYSQEARFYTMTFLLSALSYLFFIRGFRYVRILDFVFYIFFTTILLYTHYFGMVIFATQVLTFIILAGVYKRETAFVIRGLVTGIMVSILFLPWVSIILKHMGVEGFWIQRPNAFFVLEYYYGYLGKDIVQALILAVFVFLFARAFLKDRSTGSPRTQYYVILILWLLLSYLIPYVRSLVSTPILHIRYSIISLPAWIIIFSLGGSTIPQRRLKLVLALCIVLSATLNLILFRHHYSTIQKQQIREVSRFVQTARPDLPVYSVFPEHFSFYFPASRPVRSSETADPKTVQEFWLLQAYFFSEEEYANELQKLQDVFTVTEEHTFHKTKAVLFVKKEPAQFPGRMQ